ncbi:MAG: hypothetical protein NXH95_11940 [Pseudomonadaceae bacterium]|nr:hypothetical protein [Pseudomonadaceae bacterium]
MNQRLVAAEETRATLDRSGFDLEAALDATDYDAEVMIDFVNKSIALEQYPRTKRGCAVARPDVCSAAFPRRFDAG